MFAIQNELIANDASKPTTKTNDLFHVANLSYPKQAVDKVVLDLTNIVYETCNNDVPMDDHVNYQHLKTDVDERDPKHAHEDNPNCEVNYLLDDDVANVLNDSLKEPSDDHENGDDVINEQPIFSVVQQPVKQRRQQLKQSDRVRINGDPLYPDYLPVVLAENGVINDNSYYDYSVNSIIKKSKFKEQHIT